MVTKQLRKAALKLAEIYETISASVQMFLSCPCGIGDVLTVRACQFTVFDFQLVQHCWLVCKVFKAPPTNISVTWHLIIFNVGVPRRLQSALWYTFDSGEGKACFSVFTGK